MSEGRRGSGKGHQLGMKLRELEEQIQSTEGYRIHLKLRALYRSYYVFAGNYHDLVMALDYFGRIEVVMEGSRLEQQSVSE